MVSLGHVHGENATAAKAVWKELTAISHPIWEHFCFGRISKAERFSPMGPDAIWVGQDRAMRLILYLPIWAMLIRKEQGLTPLAARCLYSSWNGGAPTAAKSLCSTLINEAFELLWQIDGLINSKMERDLKASSSSVFLCLWSARYQETVCKSNAKSLLSNHTHTPYTFLSVPKHSGAKLNSKWALRTWHNFNPLVNKKHGGNAAQEMRFLSDDLYGLSLKK